MFETILVPLDGSHSAEHAIPAALAVARRTGGRIRLAHVFVPMPGPFPADLPDDFAARQEREARDRAAEYLERLARRLDDLTQQTVGYDVVTGSVADGVHAIARLHGADLIVMTTHGRGGFARAWLGSGADAVVRGTGVPVLLTRPRSGEVEISADVRLSRVIVPLDGSDLAEEALGPAASLAGTDGRITLVAVAAPPLPDAGPTVSPILMRPMGRESEAHAYLQQVAARLAAGGVGADVRVLAHAAPAVAILEATADAGADIIAIATHGRGGIARFVLGSTADKVIRGATVPVLAWRPRTEGNDSPAA